MKNQNRIISSSSLEVPTINIKKSSLIQKSSFANEQRSGAVISEIKEEEKDSEPDHEIEKMTLA